MSKSSQECYFIVRSANKHHVQLDLFSILEEHFCQNHLKNVISLLDQLTNIMYNWISFLYWRNSFVNNHLKNVISLLDQLTNIMYDWISFYIGGTIMSKSSQECYFIVRSANKHYVVGSRGISAHLR